MWLKQIKCATQCCRIKFVIKIAVWNENVFVKSGYVARSFELKQLSERFEISFLSVTHDFSNIHKRIRLVKMPTKAYRIVLVKYDTDSVSKDLAIYIEQTPLRLSVMRFSWLNNESLS